MAILRWTLTLGTLAVMTACAGSTAPKTPRTVDGPVVTCDACAFDTSSLKLTVDGFPKGTKLDQIRWDLCDSSGAVTTSLDVSITHSDPLTPTPITVSDAPTDCQCACVSARKGEDKLWTNAFNTTAAKSGTKCSDSEVPDCAPPATTSTSTTP